MNYKAREKGNIPEASAWHLVLGKRNHSSKEENLRESLNTAQKAAAHELEINVMAA